MGVVYLAEDERLGRQVALKFLPASWTADEKVLERFRLEARAAGSLSHPGICAIFDIGQDGDTPFIVMEALKGQTLRDRIALGPVKVTDVLDMGIQLADALDTAHKQGIVHRDIKPSNIFVSDKNRVKVLDFGLAKLMAATPTSLSTGRDTTASPTMMSPDDQMTVPGTALGTISYMSPEQARGEDIDSRTDLFSLGVVLYEMATGHQAFGGSTSAIVFDAILNRSPRQIAHLNPLAPQRLEAVIATALEKDRDLRYQHASDLQAELKRIRRDLDSASFVGSQVGLSASHQPAELVSGATTAVPVGTWRPPSWQTGIALVASVAAISMGVWMWRGYEPAVQPAASASPEVGRPLAAGAAGGSETTDATENEEAVPAPRQAVASTAGASPTRPTPTEARAAPPAAAPPVTPRAAPARVESSLVPPSQPAGDRSEPAQAPTAREPAILPPAVEEAPAAESAAAALPPVTGPAPSSGPPAASAAPAPTPVASAPDIDRRAAAATAQAPPALPAAPLEDDEAAIRRVLRSYEQAIETKDLALYRAVRPRVSSAAEEAVQRSFRDVDSQEVEIRIEELTIDGAAATARISRRDTLVTGGRRQTATSTQALQFEKTAAGWVIAE